MKTLFQINQTYLVLAEVLEENGGELTPELEQALTIQQEELSAKSESYIHVIRKIEAEVEMAKAYEEQAKVYRKRKETVIARLKKSLEDAAKLYGKYEAGIHTVSTRKSEQVIITDAEKIPSEYLNRKIIETPDKSKIKAFLKNGEKVEGAELVTNQNLSIR
jgi:hypothetical protein